MQVKLTSSEADIAKVIFDDRRHAIRSLLILFEIHDKAQAKQLIDSFPYVQGQEIPLIRIREGEKYLVWSCSSHIDLIHDLNDRYNWMQRPPKQDNEALKTRHFTRDGVRSVHEILKKVESVSGHAYREYTEELLDEGLSLFKNLKTYELFVSECKSRADKQTTDVIADLIKNYSSQKGEKRSASDMLKEALSKIKEIPTVV